MTTVQSFAILDVGHGNCAVVIDRRGVVVIDAGSGSALLEYMTEQKVKTIDVVLISHADKDHIGGLVALIASGEFVIRRVCVNTDSQKESQIWDALVYELTRAHSVGHVDFRVGLSASAHDEFSQGDFQIQVVAPSAYLAAKGPGSRDRLGRRITTNSHSAVIRVLVGGVPVALLPGDLDEIGLDDLIHFGASVAAPLLVFPHHGGRSAAGSSGVFVEKLCRHVGPKTVVFSIGRGLHGTPRPEIVAAIKAHVPDVRIACTQLSFHCAKVLPPVNVRARHLAPVFAHGRDAGACCAGSVIVYLKNPSEVIPLHEEHQSFVQSVATNALCR